MRETYLTILNSLLLKIYCFKLEMSLLFSGVGATVLVAMQWIIDTSFLGVTMVLILITCGLITTDFYYGNRASAYKENYKGIESTKITYTILKFGMFFVWLFLAFSIQHQFRNIEWFQYILSGITSFPIFLVNLREFVSIGENIEVIYKKKPYIFILIDKVFLSMEKKFINRLDQDDE